MKILKARMGFKKGILIVILFFSLIVCIPSVDLIMLEDLGLGALGALAMVVWAETRDDGDRGGALAHGAHGADGGH